MNISNDAIYTTAQVREIVLKDRQSWAKICLESVMREPGYNGQSEGYGPVTTPRTGTECAALIENGSLVPIEKACGSVITLSEPTPPESVLVCYETYQVVGVLLEAIGMFRTDKAQKILDNLSEARKVHDDVLPFEVVKK